MLWITNLISITIMRYTKFIALLATMLVSVACFQDDLDFGGERIDTESDIITIYGNVARFADCEVSTRANKTPEESYVSKMALAVFAKESGECIHYELRDGSNLLYTLDRAKIRENHGDKYDDKECVMYIFANMPSLESSWNGTLQGLLDLAYPTPGLTRPDTGFPMIGSLGDESRDGKRFKLIPISGNRLELPTVDGIPTDYLNIPMSAIFAKMSFEITVSPDQDVDVHAPARFEMTGYEVHNLPKAVSFNSDKNKEGIQEVSSELVEVAISGIAQGGDEGSGSKIEFDFYLPERLVTPSKALDNVLPTELKKGTYGEDVDADQNGYRDKDERYHQRYKPLLLGDGQTPTYITIKGKYRDHHEQYYGVEYDIYLGADNYGDFNIERNNQYYNKLNIRGIASSNDQTQNENSISIDHRVNVDRLSSPLIVSIRRETQLDAHFEVRPMRLRISGDLPDGATAVVEVLDENGGNVNIPSWVRLEKSGTTGDHITTAGSSYGKRKYFTTDLVTNTLKNSTRVEVTDLKNDANSTVWIYVDEANPAEATPTRTTRSATIRVTYSDNKNYKESEGKQVVKDYHISQYNLHEIEGAYYKQKYHIECYEEYLYNYDSEDSYGQIREEGLPWGLDGEQLSHRYMSFNQATHAPNIDWGKYKNSDGTVAVPPYYDFYTSKYDSFANDYGGIVHNATTYPGCEFTKQIAEYSNSVKYLDLSEQAKSAVEYCYSRNKINAVDGTVDVKWYLPSVDELEDFIVPAFNYYKEFQENYYWTSQPAYIRNVFYYEYQANRISSKKISHPKVYDDNKTHARATKLVNIQSTLTPIPSGLNALPNPEVNRMPNGNNYDNFGYFNEMHFYHHRYQGVFSGLDEDGGPTKTPSVNGRDERSEHDGVIYYFHLGHLEDLIQEVEVNGVKETGYLPRKESHRVRCVRKVQTQNNN